MRREVGPGVRTPSTKQPGPPFPLKNPRPCAAGKSECLTSWLGK